MKKILLCFTGLLLTQTIVAQWEPEVRLTNAPGSSVTSYNNGKCIAAKDDTIHIVWEDNRDGQYQVYYKRSTNCGISWSESTCISNSNILSKQPCIAISGSLVHVFWYSEQWVGNFEVYYKRSADGGQSWEPEQRLTNAKGNSWELSASASGSTVHVVWEDCHDSLFLNPEIFYQRSINGGVTWEPEIQISNAEDYTGYPSIASAGAFVHVVWEDYRNLNGDIYYKRSIDGGLSWGEETRLTDDPGDSWSPCIAVSDTVVHVVWSDWRNNMGAEIYYKNSPNNGCSWEEDTQLTYALSDALFPSIAASASMVHVVWTDNPFITNEIYYLNSEDYGDIWDASVPCLSNLMAYSDYPSIASSGTSVFVVWMDNCYENFEIYYKCNPTGNIVVGTDNDFTEKSNPPFVLYPNPASSIIHIQLDGILTGQSILTIRNILGETLISHSFRNNDVIVDVSALLNGIYFVDIAKPEKKTESRKLVISK
jgi:hypothetical protein